MRVFVTIIVLLMPGSVPAQESCPPFAMARFIDPGPQSYDVVSKTTSPLGHTIVEIHFGALKGRYGKRYLFVELQGECILRAVSAGSYESTARFDAKMNPDKKTRLYHLDLYQSDMQTLLGFFDGPPALSVVKNAAADVFKTPISKSEPQ